MWQNQGKAIKRKVRRTRDQRTYEAKGVPETPQPTHSSHVTEGETGPRKQGRGAVGIRGSSSPEFWVRTLFHPEVSGKLAH
jgi:hypothetical protein